MYVQHFLITDAVQSREDEFAAWYAATHIPDVMRIRLASVAGQLFQRSGHQPAPTRATRCPQRFLALFEGTDPQAMTGTYGGPNDEKMELSDAADHAAGLGGGYFDAILQHTKTPGEWPALDLITEWIEPEDAIPSMIDWYITSHFSTLLKTPAIHSGWFGKRATHQLFEAPRPAYAASYRVSNIAAAAQSFTNTTTALIAYERKSPRITRLETLASLKP